MTAEADHREPRLRQVGELLRSQSTMTLSTCDDAGWPQSTPLFYYADDDLALYWFSSPRSAHSRHVLREHRAAVSVFRSTDQWQEIRGVQMRGDVAQIGGSLRRTIAPLYCRRFHLGTVFGLTLAKSRLFRFVPSWIRYLDNSQGMGFKFELTLPGAGRHPGDVPLAAESARVHR